MCKRLPARPLPHDSSMAVTQRSRRFTDGEQSGSRANFMQVVLSGNCSMLAKLISSGYNRLTYLGWCCGCMCRPCTLPLESFAAAQTSDTERAANFYHPPVVPRLSTCYNVLHRCSCSVGHSLRFPAHCYLQNSNKQLT
jgi:hypothetical protein